MPFALATALNTSANDVQSRLRLEMHAKFSIERKSVGFMERLIKIRRDDRATKAKLQATVRIEGPEGNESRGKLLTRHIEGGTRTAGEAPFALPSDTIRPGPYSAVPRNLYPKNLRVMARRDASGMLGANVHVTKKGKLQIKGKQRTFVIVKNGRLLGVYQREGRGGGHPRDQINLLWAYRDAIRLPRRFRFYAVAEQEFARVFPANWARAFALAMRTAR